MKPIQGSNNNVHNKDINKAELTNSENVLFDERSDHTVSHTRIKPTSHLESFKAFVQQAINAIRAAFNFKTHQQIPTSNIKADIIPKAETLKNGINNQLIVDEVNVISSPLNNMKASSNDPLLDDFEIIESLDDFNMGDKIKIKGEIKNTEENILVETTNLLAERADDPYSLENAKAFLAYFEKNANWADISSVAVNYAKNLVVKHADTSEKEFNLKPEIRSNVENAKKLIAQSNLNDKNKIENLSLGMADLSDELLKNLELGLPSGVKNPKKELPSEVNKELSAREKYLNDWSGYVIQAFYPENYSNKDNLEIIQTKDEAKIFLDWKAKWSNIMFEGNETQKSEGPEGAKRVKNYYKEAFNIKNQMSIKELEACNRFIRKFDFILKNSSPEKRQEIENLELEKYVDDFLDFYNHEQIKILTEKKSAEKKSTETKSAETIIGSTSSEKANNEKSIYFSGIIALQELTINDVQSLHTILAPDLDLSVFEVFMVDTKKYFESIATGIAPIENQKGAALTIAALWTKLTGNDQPSTNTDEVSYFVNQISQFFIKNPIAELKEFPNFEKLNTLFDLEKISNDFK
jgi:hypothetical protein